MLYRKIGPLFGLLTLLVLFGFVTSTQNHMPCTGVEINVQSKAQMFFIDRTDVYHQIVNTADSVEGQVLSALNIQQIEDAIAAMPEVKSVDVFRTINGKLEVKVDLRVPIARVFYPNGHSFYLDEEGGIMPLSNKYTARVLTVNGFVWDTKIPADKDVPEVSIWDKQQRDVYRLATFIESDPFWKAQIQQVYVDENLEYVLIPRVGNYEIQFGEMDRIERKFSQLNAFYEQALSKSGWNKYRSINLKYKDQIVCRKK